MALHQAGTGALSLTYMPSSVVSILQALSQHIPLQAVPVSFFMNWGVEISAHALFGDLFLQWFAVFF